MSRVTRHDDGTSSWKCETGKCTATVTTYRGRDTTCHVCGQWFNGGGQRLRNDWMNNPSYYNDNISDMEGYEIQHAGD